MKNRYKFIHYIGLISIILVITSCTKEESGFGPEEPGFGPDYKYKSGLIIKTDYVKVNGEVLGTVKEPNLLEMIPSKLNGFKSSSALNEDVNYSMFIEDMDGITTQIKAGGADYVTFQNLELIYAINEDYVLLYGIDNGLWQGQMYGRDHIERFITLQTTIPHYIDMTVMDTVSIDSISNNMTYIHKYDNSIQVDTLYSSNIIDTIDNGRSVILYDTITVNSVNEPVNMYYSNILYNVKTGKLYDFGDQIKYSSQTINFKNDPLLFNEERTKFYYWNGDWPKEIIEIDLTGEVPKRTVRYKQTNYEYNFVLDAIHPFGDNILMRSLHNKHFFSVSGNGKLDSLNFETLGISADAFPLTIKNSLYLFDISGIYKVDLLNDTLNISRIKPDYCQILFQREATTKYTYNNLIFLFETRNADKIISINPDNLTLEYIPISGIPSTTGAWQYYPNTSEMLENYLVVYSDGQLFKIEFGTSNVSRIESMNGIKISDMASDNNNLLVFYGYDTNKGKYVKGKVDINGVITDLEESDLDNSGAIISKIGI